MKNNLSIYWFRQDLRLSDNLGLYESANCGSILCIYILDEHVTDSNASLGASSRWWLHSSLKALDSSLNGNLRLYKGDSATVISKLCDAYNINHVSWSRCYEKWRITQDEKIKNQLKKQGINVRTFNASLLQEPSTISKKDGTHYKVFTPYYQQFMNSLCLEKTVLAPKLKSVKSIDDHSLALKELNLLPKIAWYTTMDDLWQPGEKGAQSALKLFLEHGINEYRLGRDYPFKNGVSRLSPHLHFGEISPKQIFKAIDRWGDDNNIEHFKRELIWREFSYYLLYHRPEMVNQNLKPLFDHFPWQHNQAWLKAWQKGLTGYPIVDAGMRELWKTGYMHNRLRMISASFLVKNLLIDWRCGADWFWDCLVDADLASNSASWQWVAGCGTDSAPYFRIFNPITQGEKFDPEGEYTKRFVPELKKLPNKYLFKPWTAPNNVLQEAGIRLGVDYPTPIVDIKKSRQKALDAFYSLNQFKN